MIWKVYLIIMALMLALSGVSAIFVPQHSLFAVISSVVFRFVELVGLFAYVYKKNIVTMSFWRFYFWFNVVLDILALVYIQSPHFVGISWYAIFVPGEPGTMLEGLLGVLLDCPLLYAMYRIAQGKFYEKKIKKILRTVSGSPKWGMLQAALWGYSVIVSSFFGILALFPIKNTSANNTGPSDSSLVLWITLPLFLFWLGIVWQYKEYVWNWIRVTLCANGLFFTGLIAFSFLFDNTTSTQNDSLNWFVIAQFGIIIGGYIVFGKEQFAELKVKKEKKLA